MEELLPVFERTGINLALEPHPDDFVEDGCAAVDLVRGINSSNVSFLYCAPHTFHMGNDARGIMRHAGDLLTHVHVADTFDHTASSGKRYIVNPPWSTARVHQHLDIGQGEVDWDELNNATWSVHAAGQVVYKWAATAALRRSALQRYFRDLHAGTQYVTSGPVVLQNCGKRLSGLAPDAHWAFLDLQEQR